MKHFTLTILLFTLTLAGFSQSTGDVEIFSEDGQPFYAVINGVKQNATPETNVRITGLEGEAQRLKIIFEDTRIPVVTKNLYVPLDHLTTYRIKKNRRGDYKVRGYGEPVALTSTQEQTGQTVVAYHKTPIQENSGKTTTKTETTTTETTTTNSDEGGNVNIDVDTGTNGGNQTEGVSMNVNVSENGMNMDVKVNGEGSGVNTSVSGSGDGTGANSSVSSSTTTTTTTSSSSTNTNTEVSTEESAVPGYTGTIGCTYPMSSTEFSEAKSSIEDKSFEDSKMTLAKQVIKNKCVTAEQIADFMNLFDFEDSKLELAKFAYDYTYDQDNYYKVNDAFDFEMTIEELNEYIESK